MSPCFLMNSSSTWWATNLYEPWWLISRRGPRVTEQVRMSMKRTQNSLWSVIILSKVARQKQVHLCRWLNTLTSRTRICIHKQPSVLQETGNILGAEIPGRFCSVRVRDCSYTNPSKAVARYAGSAAFMVPCKFHQLTVRKTTLCQIRSVIG